MNLNAESGRPFLFTVQRDFALEHGDAAGVRAAERRTEMWHRAPEEWEWGRLANHSIGYEELRFASPIGMIDIFPSLFCPENRAFLLPNPLRILVHPRTHREVSNELLRASYPSPGTHFEAFYQLAVNAAQDGFPYFDRFDGHRWEITLS